MKAGTILLNGSYAPSLLNFRGPLIRDLIDRGYEVHVSAPGINSEIRAKLRELSAQVIDLPLVRTGTSILGDLSYFRALRKIIDAIRPDLVVGYTIKPNIWGSLAARSCSVRSASMVTGLGYAFAKASRRKDRLLTGISRRLYRLATDANDVVIFQNPDDLTDFVAAGCLGRPDKARIVNGSGVDIMHYAPVPLPREPVFLMIARLLGAKGTREYAAAASILSKRHPDWRFLLVGFLDKGPDCVDTDELAHWQENGIEYLGEKGDIREAMREASVYVLPSYREGTPRSVLEAMAMGRPVITSDAPGCRETVTDGRNGLLVPVRDAKALTVAMERLGQDAELRARMGAESISIARDKYSVDKVNHSLIEYLGL